MSRKRVLSLLLLLAVLALVASGCAPQIADDGTVTAPTWIAPLAKPLEWLIESVYTYILTPIGLASYGLAIILVTILIRALLYPLTRKQMQSMKKQQAIQPKLKELQEKYGKDREKLSQKQMELYKQEGVNPAGGCLPLLIQMPILFAFYYALLLLGPKLDQPFLWIPSLAQPEYGQGMSWLQPITPAHLLSPAVLPFLILPIIYVVTQFIMQRMSQASNPTVGGGSMSTVMMLMPVMFGYITLIVPSGLSLYWVTSNIIQIIQQGLATGWSGLLPNRKAAPAAATSGSASAQGAVITTTGTPTSVSGTTENVSAGRRRKMRKKKR
ncbi:MAG: membrane protein insertase YidC [Caldilineae bacterium]|nr:membrane protein insertase YidC [Caldilineae bacterium]